MTFAPAPCAWDYQECGPLPATGSPELAQIQEAASGVLWALSGRQFGCCDFLLRPCRTECQPPAGVWGRPWTALLDGGAWINVVCGRCGDPCSCSEVCELLLPWPVCEITEVTLDGDELDDSAWRVDDGRLVRTDGGCWPTCQEMALPATEPGTWSVAGTAGIPVPAAGQRALGELMSELWKACSNQPCSLPKRVQTITKQGISAVLLDPMTFLEHGLTGLYFVDLWLSAVNPLRRPSGARVLSPDMPRHRTNEPSAPGP